MCAKPADRECPPQEASRIRIPVSAGGDRAADFSRAAERQLWIDLAGSVAVPLSAHRAHPARLSQLADGDPTLRWKVDLLKNDHDHRKPHFVRLSLEGWPPTSIAQHPGTVVRFGSIASVCS